MRTITFAQATLEAMAVTMEEDPTVFVMGEDIARQGGIFGQFKNLARQFPDRVIDTPISETFIVGGGVGAGVKVTPVCFLVVKDGNVRILTVAEPANTTADRIVEMVPETLDRISALFEKKKE